jgi:recombination protein RecR
VLALLDWDHSRQRDFGNTIASLPQKVGECPECGACSENGDLCVICRSSLRDESQLCVVETLPQLQAIESSGRFRGKYLVLGGRLSPLDAENGEGLRLALLQKKAFSGTVKEVILALSPDVEGRATAAYIAELLAEAPIRLTRPATGLPAGANLSYADGATIAAALAGRRDMEL